MLNTSKVCFDIAEDREPSFEIKYRLCENQIQFRVPYAWN